MGPAIAMTPNASANTAVPARWFRRFRSRRRSIRSNASSGNGNRPPTRSSSSRDSVTGVSDLQP